MPRHYNGPRRVIAVDLDEVLARTSLAIADFHNDTYGTNLTMDDFISYDYSKIWGGTREESIHKWRAFFDSPYFLKVEPVEGSLETLKLLKARRFSLVIVTARQQFVAELTKKFVDRHYPGIFESIYFANHYLTEQERLTFISKPKSAICRDVGAELLIDDSLENAIEVAQEGIAVLLFDLHGEYLWNKLAPGEQLPEKITRVKSWKDIQAWFPRPRSPLSSQVFCLGDPLTESEDDDEEEEDDEDEDEEDEDEDEEDEEDEEEEEMDEDLDEGPSKREQEDVDTEEADRRTLQRRKMAIVGYDSDEDLELGGHGIDMDSDEDGDGTHVDRGYDEGDVNIHADAEEEDADIDPRAAAHYLHHHHQYQQQQQPFLEGSMEQDGSESDSSDHDGDAQMSAAVGVDGDMDVDLEMAIEDGTISQTTLYAAQSSSSPLHGAVAGAAKVATTDVHDNAATTTTTIPGSPSDDDDDRASAASSESSSSTLTPDTMAVEGLTIKSPPTSSGPTMDMEEVSLS
ncbi:hypothetical protein DFQ27_004581 [Actinomortierella ambigua]|uniref:Uncharacterized protein n=1 Tax=Actinomortierella ambigua TaxID=1343610 RepID=A0A9P6QLK1_9FUNG|nr:hypothetical protein DFQ27_004581 [Actinomortierella ambigua]